LHLCVSARFQNTYQVACRQVEDLLKNIYEEYRQWTKSRSHEKIYQIKKFEAPHSKATPHNYSQMGNMNNNSFQSKDPYSMYGYQPAYFQGNFKKFYPNGMDIQWGMPMDMMKNPPMMHPVMMGSGGLPGHMGVQHPMMHNNDLGNQSNNNNNSNNNLKNGAGNGGTINMNGPSSGVINDVDISDAEIKKLIEERNKARRESKFEEADRIRNYLKSKGIALMDEKGGRGKGSEVTTWKHCKVGNFMNNQEPGRK
jgi:hypothetical protein